MLDHFHSISSVHKFIVVNIYDVLYWDLIPLKLTTYFRVSINNHLRINQ